MIICPYCKSEKVIRIHNAEVYEYDFICADCNKGFNIKK